VRQRLFWVNTAAATANSPFSLRSFNPARRSAANRSVSASAAPSITGRRLPSMRNIARSAAIARENGGPVILITGSANRTAHPKAVERNRQQQKLRDRRQHLRNLANNTSALDLKHSAAAVWLVGAGAEFLANNNSAPAQVWVIEALAPRPSSAAPPCKQHPSGLEAVSAG
jgi:hypothetical protein